MRQGSLLLTATLGLGITYLVYQSMNYMMVPFAVPFWPAAVMTAFLILVCILIPLAAGKYMTGKGSVMERVRGGGEKILRQRGYMSSGLNVRMER